MSPDQQQVMQASGRHIEAGLSAQPLRWFITGSAGVGKSFVISMLRESIFRARALPFNISTKPVVLTAPTGVWVVTQADSACQSWIESDICNVKSTALCRHVSVLRVSRTLVLKRQCF